MMNQALPSRIPLIDTPQSLAIDIVSAIHDVGDRMKEQAALNQYITHNHDKNEFWDALNTNICQALNSPDCMSHIKKSGFWEFLLADYKPARLLFTFMREQRFKVVQADIKKNGSKTYVNMLVQHFNKDLLADMSQISLYPIHTYDEVELSGRIKKLIGDFREESNIVEHYMMVLFDCDSSYELRGVKAVIVDPNLDIVEEADWSQYIPVEETAIVEKVSDVTSPSNNPSRGLTLKPKALERKLQQEDEDSDQEEPLLKKDGNSDKEGPPLKEDEDSGKK